MKLISENLHIISKSTKEAVLNRDEDYIKKLLERQILTNPDWIDLNIGPAKGAFAGSMEWLTNILQDMTDIPLSFDSTNTTEIAIGLSLAKKPDKCIINSTSADYERLNNVTDLAAEYDCSLIGLTMNADQGIPKEADSRLELAFEITSITESKNITNDRVFFDPLVLPICVEQTQAKETLNTIIMLKESFEPQVMTTIGLSNISNGCPREIRPLINRVFFVLAYGCGLDSAIVDSFDSELQRINKIIESNTPETNYDMAYLNIFNMMKNYQEIEDIDFDRKNIEQTQIIKTAKVLLNREIYSNSYLEI